MKHMTKLLLVCLLTQFASASGHQGRIIKPGLHTEMVNRYYDGSVYFKNVTIPTLSFNATDERGFMVSSECVLVMTDNQGQWRLELPRASFISK